jgi:hypothetical protein
MIRRGLKPGFKPEIDRPGDNDRFRRVFLGWNLADVLVLYWAESSVIALKIYFDVKAHLKQHTAS